MLISCVAFFTTTEAADPDLSVLLLLPLLWPFTVLLLEADLEDPLCLELSFDALPTIFDDPFTSFDVEVTPLAVAAVSSLGLFSAGGEPLHVVVVVLPLASGKPSSFIFGRVDDVDWSEAHATAVEALSLDSDSGGDSVLRFLCV